jgi:hypothetical protein
MSPKKRRLGVGSGQAGPLGNVAHGGGHINVVQGGSQVLNVPGKDGWLIAKSSSSSVSTTTSSESIEFAGANRQRIR